MFHIYVVLRWAASALGREVVVMRCCVLLLVQNVVYSAFDFPPTCCRTADDQCRTMFDVDTCCSEVESEVP